MAFSDSLFLFEIRVEDIKSCIDTKLFRIRSQFGDIFTLHLRDPNEGFPQGSLRRGRKKKEVLGPVPTVQTVMVSANINSLEQHLEKYPLYLCAWTKGNPYSLGSTYISWSPKYIDYLESLKRFENPDPVLVKGKYYIYNEYNSKKMAAIWLSIKLTRMAENVHNKVEPLSPTTTTPSFAIYNDDPETNVNMYDNPKPEDIGIIRTVYRGDNRLVKHTNSRKKVKVGVPKNTENKESEKALTNEINQTINRINASNDKTKEKIKKVQHETVKSGKLKLIRSNTETHIKTNALIKSKSCSSIQTKQRLNIFDYIFSEYNGPYANNVYCVGYCTVKNDNSPTKNSSKTSSSNQSSVDSKTTTTKSSKTSPTKEQVSSKTSQVSVSIKHTPDCDHDASEKQAKYVFKICADDCERQGENKSFQNTYSLDLPEKVGHMMKMVRCTEKMTCPYQSNEILPEPDKQILINVKNLKGKSCSIKTVEEIEGGIQMEMNTDDPCYCKCDCKFGVRRTTYCSVCGGYEIPGETGVESPNAFPCPIFHKLERRPKEKAAQEKKKKRSKGSSLDSEKAEQSKTDDRFKFNYGYKGIPPQIGHSQCCVPCGGHSKNVPNHMGWLWNAGNVPGLKFRPYWRPGAANKHVVRMLRIAKNPEQVKAKRLRKKIVVKRPLKRPLLVVEKKDGEYTVTMETMKVYNKPRPPNMYPYEDKPVLTFTIGRTEEENALRAKLKARKKDHLESEKRQYIEKTFKNLCQEICYKTYQQALGILPGSEDPTCPCMPAQPDSDFQRACSCSDRETSCSDATATDDDEWLVEFTPPNAFFDPTTTTNKQMPKGSKQDHGTQYTYLDYAVKLFDSYGIPVPRFFIGPDGKQQCSDLGGFWGPDNKWLEINEDGIVGPDGRWAPVNFLGPDGAMVDAREGKFELPGGDWLIVGIDGYVENGKWRKYSTPRPMPEKMKKVQKHKKADGDKPSPPPKIVETKVRPSETTWSCFGDADPKVLGKMGISGHGHDRKLLLSTLQQLMKNVAQK